LRCQCHSRRCVHGQQVSTQHDRDDEVAAVVRHGAVAAVEEVGAIGRLVAPFDPDRAAAVAKAAVPRGRWRRWCRREDMEEGERGDWRSRAGVMQQRRGEVGGCRAAARVPLSPRFLCRTRPSAELLCSLLAYLKSIQPTTTSAATRGTGGGGGGGLPYLPSTGSGGGDGKPAAPSNLPSG
jgi:hypothetical protein